MRIIAHIDMDAFFASVEQVQKPWLKGKPIGVSNNPKGRSVIATASYEAREYGIKSGMPVKEALKRLPTLIIVKGQPKLYESISDKIYSILLRYAPSVERFSIDEAFLDLSYVAKNYDEAKQIAVKIKQEIVSNTGLPSTIGISYNKLMAKIASKEGKPNGLFLIREEEALEFLKNLPVSKIPGIGKKVEEKLKEQFNVENVEDLQKISLNDLIKVFHTYGVFLYQAARGIDDSPVVNEFEESEEKSIGNSTTLDFDTDDMDIIKGVIKKLSSNVGFRLRSKNFLTSKLFITIRYEDFTTFSHGRNIPFTNSDFEIFTEAFKMFKELYNGQRVRLLGITATNLMHPSLSLFEKGESKEEKIFKTMDFVREKYDNNPIAYADNIKLDIQLIQRKISGRK